MTRQRVFQQAPDEQGDYRDFPRRTIKAGSRWFRQHLAHVQPWWFSSSADGRFDLAPPYGTCYLAATPQSALRERLGPDLAIHGRVAASLIDGRVVSELTLPHRVKAADLESDRASTVYGITGELTVMTPYDVTRAWARVMHRSAFGGVLGRLRFSLGREDVGLGLFGDAGSRDDWLGDAEPVEARPLAAAMGVVVVEPPEDDEVTYV